MNFARFAIRQQVFVICAFFVILLLGIVGYSHLRTELYPDVSFPVVNVIVPFPGAGPQEVESQLLKPLENAVSDLAGVRSVRSRSLEGVGIMSVVFTLNTDIRLAEQSVSLSVSRARGEFPQGTLEPTISALDPSDVPLMTLALSADLPEDKLNLLADLEIRPKLEEVANIGSVRMEGARKREIEVELDRQKLTARQMSAMEVVQSLRESGVTVPAGVEHGPDSDTLVRSVGDFKSLEDIRLAPIRFPGNETIVSLREIADVRDGMTDEKMRAHMNGRSAVIYKVFRQHGADALETAKALDDRVAEIERTYQDKIAGFSLSVAHDGTAPIRESADAAREAILIGIVLAIVVVYLFLGSLRSTFITAVALPNSIFGAFLMMWFFDFSLNITTLAAVSLAVGLLIDDAIVVRESIFRMMKEEGGSPEDAAVRGTAKVAMAVVATTLTVLSVFGPIAFLKGIIGQFFKEFGLTICFAMLISLLDSLTVAPMLSAKMGKPGPKSEDGSSRSLSRSLSRSRSRGVAGLFDRFQLAQERLYLRSLDGVLKRPGSSLLIAALIFAGSLLVLNRIPKAFLPPSGSGEFEIKLTLPPGTSLQKTDDLALGVDSRIRAHAEVAKTLVEAGGVNGESNEASIVVMLKDPRQRKASTVEMKERARSDLAGFPGQFTVEDIFAIGGGAGEAYTLHLSGQEIAPLAKAADELVARLKDNVGLTDVQSSYRAGSPELRITYDPKQLDQLGVTSGMAGQELRTLLSGATPAHFHDEGSLEQYDIRVRLRPDQRDLGASFRNLWVPNLNHRLVPLKLVATAESVQGPAMISREDKKRFVEISAGLQPGGPGLGRAIELTRRLLDSGEIKLPAGATYAFSGQTKDFQDTLAGALMAIAASVAFMYLILASLYRSFVTPWIILLVLPLAVCGAVYALALSGKPLEINSVIGCILLLGVAAKNSILLVDHVLQGLGAGSPLSDAIHEAARERLRPILMTTFALIAGMLPVALPLAEASEQRAGMAIAVIGGLISSTFLTLFIIPAAYVYAAKVARRFGLVSESASR